MLFFAKKCAVLVGKWAKIGDFWVVLAQMIEKGIKAERRQKEGKKKAQGIRHKGGKKLIAISD